MKTWFPESVHPEPIAKLKSVMPEIYAELAAIADRLERHFGDMQDIEFTVESGKLYILQTRNGKRTGRAAVKIAIDMMIEGLLTREEAVMRVTVDDIRGMLHKQLESPDAYHRSLRGLMRLRGLPGGKVFFNAGEALDQARKGVSVILVRPETSPDDIRGIAHGSRCPDSERRPDFPCRRCDPGDGQTLHLRR